ncbi:subclass B1 metallo-beta-lactamase [Shewanella eurypsychrophilus]|uniref:beta-lactamase n=1 Tax=Shewanella eurypsychrophilus TaxID=2593656 RepID=A0ABX6V320_9GAMM|nr:MULTISPECIES: subclass B1 metallo-beta-lactamase [Shewanella]QFU21736.1 subclass B1 metallo-beta-lactamase [Shewanella sp. YLB-09]QPG57027.1 subclass B1 metallo-beta-lactamase [Shewanella eurypsychrophilus]
MSISSSHAIELKGANQTDWSSEVIDIEMVSSTLYLVRSYQEVKLSADKPAVKMGANSFIYIDNKDAYLIDTPWNVSDMPDLMNWLKIKGLTLRGALVTHYHADSAAGLGYLDKKGVVTYASELTNTLLEQDKKPTSNHTFLGNNFELLKGKVEAFFPGSGHSMDNLVVWLPDEQILIGGCFLKSNKTSHLGWTGDADLGNWYHAASKVKTKYADVKLVFPGHGNGVEGAKIIEHTMSLTRGTASMM